MNVKKIQPITHVSRRFDEIKVLQQELVRLENEARDAIITLDVNRHLTGYQKTATRIKLSNIDSAIESIKNKIYNIKKRNV